MKRNWLDDVRAFPLQYPEGDIRSLVKRRQLFALKLPGSHRFIVPDFQIKDRSVSPWVAPLLGALVWIEDATSDRDRDGLARGNWLYRQRRCLSESAVAHLGYWPARINRPVLESGTLLNLLDTQLAITSLKLAVGPRSFAEMFLLYPRLVIDYQYRMRGIRFDTFAES